MRWEAISEETASTPDTEVGATNPATVGRPSPSSVSPLQGLLEVTRLVRADENLPDLLAAIARTIADSLGFETVVVNLYRPAWNDFTVTTVHGSPVVHKALMGQVPHTIAEWDTLICDAFHRRGAYHVPAGKLRLGTGELQLCPGRRDWASAPGD